MPQIDYDKILRFAERYEFMMVSVPMHLEGGIATPPNAVAIK